MLSRRFVTNLSSSRRLFCSNNIATQNVDIYFKVVGMTTTIGAVGNGCNGIYTGYKNNYHKSYYDCITNTTFDFVGYTCIGVYSGFVLGVTSPVWVPLACITAPVACGVAIVKYFDKN